jgi:hypothetical protein
MENHFQVANRLHQNAEVRSVRAHPDATSINVHYLIEVRGIDGEIILFVSPENVIYFFIKNEF